MRMNALILGLAALTSAPAFAQSYTVFGSGCPGAVTASVPVLSRGPNLPISGGLFTVSLTSAPRRAPGCVMFGFQRLDFDLGPLGWPGCTLYTMPGIVKTILTEADGTFDWTVRIPPSTPRGTVFFNQFMVLDQPISRVVDSVALSNGGRGEVGEPEG